MNEKPIISQITITPATSVYATFEKLSYEQYSAYAEFIDNSTQSYFDHKEELDNLEDFNHCKIEIHHDPTNDRITIVDNCYGMNYKDFQRAIILSSVPDVTTGRNEFGMGLKTAATWFGKKWTVISTQFNENDQFKTTVDIEQLRKYKNSTVDVEITQVPRETHYTKIIIENLNKKLPATKAMTKLRMMLGGVYRRDIQNEEVEITYNDQVLNYEIPDILITSEDGENKEWKKDIKFQINYNNKTYNVTGFAAIRETGSTKYGGFTLFRRNRVIVGGLSDTYRPTEIFGQTTTFRYQRLFGELNLDDWPVSQAKDKFTWDDELEYLFIEELNKQVKDLKKKAESFRRRKQPQTLPPVAPPNDTPKVNPISAEIPPTTATPADTPKVNPISAEIPPTTATPIFIPVKQKPEYIESFDVRKYTLQYHGDVFTISAEFKSFPSQDKSLFSKKSNKNNITIYVNKNNNLVKRAVENRSLDIYTELLAYIAVSEKILDYEKDSGTIFSDSIRGILNQIIEYPLEKKQ